MGMGLSAAKTKLEMDVEKALEDAFYASYIFDPGEVGKEKASKFAKKAAKPITEAIYNFISQAQIVGTVNGSVNGTCPVGPVTGANIDVLTGSELSII